MGDHIHYLKLGFPEKNPRSHVHNDDCMLSYMYMYEHASSKARGLYLVTHTSTNSFARKFLGPHHCSLTHYHKSNPEKVPRRSDVDVAESRVYIVPWAGQILDET